MKTQFIQLKIKSNNIQYKLNNKKIELYTRANNLKTEYEKLSVDYKTTEQELCDLFKQILALDDYYPDDDFFDEFFDINSVEKISLKNDEVDEEILDAVIEIFNKQFEGKEITKYSDFYGNLGGDSLKYLILLNAISERFNVEISTTNYIPKTPEEFAKEIMRLM